MHRFRRRVRPKSLAVEFAERLLGRGEHLICAGDGLPLIVASYPRGKARFASALAESVRLTLPSLPPPIRGSYRSILDALPSVVVADLRKRNVCECLGHHHPSNTLATARRLTIDTGGRVGEIDLAVEAIRCWEPLPIATRAVGTMNRGARLRLDDLRFHVGLLSVLLHELEHVAFPSRPESQIRARSDQFYRDALAAQLLTEFGAGFGFDAPLAVS